MLKAEGVYKKYDEIEILRGIDIEIPEQVVACIVGASGAGKTTLLQILGTLDQPDKGKVLLEGREINKLKGNKLSLFRNSELGFVFQFHQLLPEFSALENVMIPALIGKKSKSDASNAAKNLLDYLGLANRVSHKPSELSGGEQQRVAVARALVNNPKLIFADEPSGNLDSENSSDLHNLFFQLKEEKKQTFVIVTHNSQLANMADLKFEMKDGKLLNE